MKFFSTITPETLNLGFIATSETDVRLSTLEGLTENFQAGLESEFVICPKISEEELNSIQRIFHVEVLVEPTDKVQILIICEKEDGNFQVKFIPVVPGTYNIKVKINGNKLANSPFTAQVRELRLDIVGELDLKGEIPQRPHGIAVNRKGLIAVAERGRHCILTFDKEGKVVRKLGCYGKNPGQFNIPRGVTYLNDEEILVADELNHRIQQFNVQTGNFVKSYGNFGTGKGDFKNPLSVCMDYEGHVVVADLCNNRIQVLTKNGKPVLKFGASALEKLNHPTGCIHHKNMFIVSDNLNHRLKVMYMTV